MLNRQQKELRRLEEALMEVEDTEEYAEEEFGEIEEVDTVWQQSADLDYDIYNTDDTDVDLDAYSEDVHRGKSGSGLGVVLTMLIMVALSACILFLLKYLGVL